MFKGHLLMKGHGSELIAAIESDFPQRWSFPLILREWESGNGSFSFLRTLREWEWEWEWVWLIRKNFARQRNLFLETLSSRRGSLRPKITIFLVFKSLENEHFFFEKIMMN